MTDTSLLLGQHGDLFGLLITCVSHVRMREALTAMVAHPSEMLTKSKPSLTDIFDGLMMQRTTVKQFGNLRNEFVTESDYRLCLN